MLEITVDFDEASLEKAFEELNKECSDIVRGLSIMLWYRILAETPQKFGRAAASWTYSYRAPLFIDRSHAVGIGHEIGDRDLDAEGMLWKGHPYAIDFATMIAAPHANDPAYRLGTEIYFANGVDHGEGHYASDLEEGAIHLRSVNRPGAMVQRAIDYVHVRYSEDIGARQAGHLKNLRMGE
jgi:hypothetical protein